MASSDSLGPHQHVLPNGATVALGRPSVKTDPRTFRLASLIVPEALPTLPDKIVHSDRGPFPLYANNVVGDCADAAVAHLWELQARLNGGDEHYTDADVIGLYSAQAGYKPGDPSTDTGSILLDLLNYLRRNPFGDDKILAFAAVDLKDTDLVRHAIQLFGGLYAGTNLPRSAQTQVGGLWDVASGPAGAAGSWGGHATVLSDFDFTLPVPEFVHLTWGTTQRCTLPFFQAYTDEGFAIVTTEWQAKTPYGAAIDFDALGRMIAEVGKIIQ